MTTPTNQIVEQAIAKQEAEEAGIVIDDPKNNNDNAGKGDDKKPTEDDQTGKPKSGESDKSADDKSDAKPKYDKDGKRIEEPADEDKPELDKDGKPVEKPKEGEFTADDALEVETPKPKEPEAPTDNAGIQLSQAEQKHIVDNIGEPIVIRGFTGEGDDRKEVQLKVYTPRDIPNDFVFASDQERLSAQTGFLNIEQKATKLLGDFRSNQSRSAAQDFERRENEGIKADVADLQKDGRFPKFTVRPGEAGFDDTPEAKQMTEVLQYMTKQNQTYLDQYNQGRPYKHIGFAEAFTMWERENSTRTAKAKVEEDQKQEDDERRAKGTDRSNTSRGMNQSNIVRPTVRPGTTTRDILARIDNEEF